MRWPSLCKSLSVSAGKAARAGQATVSWLSNISKYLLNLFEFTGILIDYDSFVWCQLAVWNIGGEQASGAAPPDSQNLSAWRR
jgi:hypothetical protein